MILIHVLSVAAFTLPQQRGGNSAKPNIFTIWPLTENYVLMSALEEKPNVNEMLDEFQDRCMLPYL